MARHTDLSIKRKFKMKISDILMYKDICIISWAIALIMQSNHNVQNSKS